MGCMRAPPPPPPPRHTHPPPLPLWCVVAGCKHCWRGVRQCRGERVFEGVCVGGAGRGRARHRRRTLNRAGRLLLLGCLPAPSRRCCCCYRLRCCRSLGKPSRAGGQAWRTGRQGRQTMQGATGRRALMRRARCCPARRARSPAADSTSLRARRVGGGGARAWAGGRVGGRQRGARGGPEGCGRGANPRRLLTLDARPPTHPPT